MAKLTNAKPRIAVVDAMIAKPVAVPVKQRAPFYGSVEWRTLSTAVVRKRGRKCESCGRDNCRVFVDHIIEIEDGGSKLEERNLQVLCGSCHSSKTLRERHARIAKQYGSVET